MKLIVAVIAVAMLVMVMEGCSRYSVDGQTAAWKLDRVLGQANLALAEAGDSLSASRDDSGSLMDSVAASVNDRAVISTLEVADAGISASIKSRLARDPALGSLKIGVESRDGLVSLSGQADGERNRARAEQLARSHKSVIGVRNNLAVDRL